MSYSIVSYNSGPYIMHSFEIPEKIDKIEAENILKLNNIDFKLTDEYNIFYERINKKLTFQTKEYLISINIDNDSYTVYYTLKIEKELNIVNPLKYDKIIDFKTDSIETVEKEIELGEYIQLNDIKKCVCSKKLKYEKGILKSTILYFKTEYESDFRYIA